MYDSTALHHASHEGHAEVAELLLAHPVINVNLQDAGGRTPLGLACQIGKVSVAQLQVCDPRVNMTLVIIVKGPRCGLLLALDAIKQWSG